MLPRQKWDSFKIFKGHLIYFIRKVAIKRNNLKLETWNRNFISAVIIKKR